MEKKAGDYTYTVENGEATIIKYSGTEENLSIPETLDGIPVRIIGEKAFANNNYIKNLTVPNGIVKLCESAFEYCIHLKELSIPPSVTTLENYVFQGCNSLEAFTLPETVTDVGGGIFLECYKLILTLPASFPPEDGYDEYDFVKFWYPDDEEDNCRLTASGQLNDGCMLRVEKDSPSHEWLYGSKFPYEIIGSKTDTHKKLRNFSYTGDMYNVTITKFHVDSISIDNDGRVRLPYTDIRGEEERRFIFRKIGEGAFENCDLEAISLQQITEIGSRAFANCKNLEFVVLGEMDFIADDAFEGCDNVEFKLVSDIFDYEYAENYAEEHGIPVDYVDFDDYYVHPFRDGFEDEVEEDENNEWDAGDDDDGSDESVETAETQESTETSDNSECAEAQETSQESESTEKTEVSEKMEQKTGDYTYTVENGEATIIKYSGTEENLSIPEALEGVPVRIVGEKAFANNNYIKNLTVPNGVVKLCESAFEYCIHLKELSIPPSVTTLEYAVFQGCNSLEAFTLPETITNIGEEVFYECNKLILTLPASFPPSEDFYTALISFWTPDDIDHCRLREKESIDDRAMYRVEKDSRSHKWVKGGDLPYEVIGSKTESDKKLRNFSYTGDLFSATITKFHADSFEPTEDRMVKLPYYDIRGEEERRFIFGKIGESAFEDNGLEAISLQEITEIGSRAFANCKNLEYVVLGQMEFIADDAFEGCDNVEFKLIADVFEYDYAENFAEEHGIPVDYVDFNDFYIDIWRDGYEEELEEDENNEWDADDDGSDESVETAETQESTETSDSSECAEVQETPQVSESMDVSEGSENLNDNFVYKVYEGEVEIVSYKHNDCDETLTIPSTIKGYPVTKIASNAFAEKNMSSIKFPDFIKNIGDGAFKECINLIKVDLSNVDPKLEMGLGVFQGCVNVQEVLLPSKMKKISAFAFCSCSNLKEIDLPTTIEYVEDSAFKGSGLTAITLTPNMAQLDKLAFAYCHSLNKVDFIPCRLQLTVSDDVFNGSRKAKLIIPVSNTELSDWATRNDYECELKGYFDA